MVNLDNSLQESCYTSVACNRNIGAFHWGKNKIIVFAACNSVAFLDPKHDYTSSAIMKTFVKHTSSVTTCKWIKNENKCETEFISGASDGSLIFWVIDSSHECSKTYRLNGHEESISNVEGFHHRGRIIVASAAADGTVRLWQKQENGREFSCFQIIQELCLALRGWVMPNSDHFVFAVATEDYAIRLYGKRKTEFVEVEKLLGHEDWVRGLDVYVKENGEMLLASSSQDTFIRLWTITKAIDSNENETDQLKIEEKSFDLISENGVKEKYTFALESVLSGHDSWVSQVNWCRSKGSTIPKLLSSSMDKTMITWKYSELDKLWVEIVRVGDVGGNSLGFLGGQFSSSGSSMLGLGFQGSFHMWHKSDDLVWRPGVVANGHFGEVRDLCWEPMGAFLLSVSADQTTRLHAPWIRKDKPNYNTWHELARPQIHGFDMQAIAMLGRYKFASCGEEKIVRTFQAPGNFVENLARISLVEDEMGKEIIESKTKGASVPSLGLSNKEISGGSDQTSLASNEETLNYFTPIELSEPPTESTLMQNTLWPETQKLYGHGYDVYSLCSTSDGTILASSAKATSADDAYIILWDTTTWKQIQKLHSHQLTVTQMKFSPNDKLLLSVSRDRRWTVFENVGENGECNFERIAGSDKKNGIHQRIIWTCDWFPNSETFVTGSRDSRAVVWTKVDQQTDTTIGCYQSKGVLTLENEPITAIAVSLQPLQSNEYLIALGIESGVIYVCTFKDKWTQLYVFEERIAHHLPVKKIAFRPGTKKQQFASCGEDNIVRIHGLSIT